MLIPIVLAMCQYTYLKFRQYCVQVLGDEPEYSSCHGRVIATLDYIWYSERTFTPGASAGRPSGNHAGSLSSINGWSPLRSTASPMGSVEDDNSSGTTQDLDSPACCSKGKDSPGSARGLGSPASSSEGKSSLKSSGSSQTAMLASRLSELDSDSQAGRGTALPGPSLPSYLQRNHLSISISQIATPEPADAHTRRTKSDHFLSQRGLYVLDACHA